MIISEFAYFTQKHLELVVYLFCLLNLQNQNKNSVSYLSKSKPRFCPKTTWLLALSLSLVALRTASEFGVAPDIRWL